MKIGIMADNYKVPTFKERLNSSGFDNVTTSQHSEGITFISVICDEGSHDQIKLICLGV